MNLNVITYRRLSFASRYGFTVRDLMLLKALESSDLVRSLTVFERPALPHELMLSVPSLKMRLGPHALVRSGIDFSYLSALRFRRRWAGTSMKRHDRSLLTATQQQTEPVILDFHPFYVPPKAAVTNTFYWYDLIDTFTKHNLFSEIERKQVQIKYQFVKQHARLVTGVTAEAVRPFKGIVLPNRLLRSPSRVSNTEPEYDIGYLGFITNKFDLDLIRRLASNGVRILVCGHSYCKVTLGELKRISNVTYAGPFAQRDVGRLCSLFRIGIVPYIVDLGHDESPIKFFQYVSNGRPVILSKKFNDIEDSFAGLIHYSSDIESTLDFINHVRNNFHRVSSDVVRVAHSVPDLYWDDSISGVLEHVLTLMRQSGRPSRL